MPAAPPKKLLKLVLLVFSRMKQASSKGGDRFVEGLFRIFLGTKKVSPKTAFEKRTPNGT